MPSSNPAQRFADIIENIELARSFVEDRARDKFEASAIEFNAAAYCLLKISEAATKLGMLAEELSPDIDWRGVRDIGNVIRHEYDVVSPAVVWKVIHDDFPALEVACHTSIRLLEERQREQDARERDKDRGRDR